MKKTGLLFAVLLAGSTIFAQNTTKIYGHEFFNSITVGNEKLELNGGGLREKYFFDLYIAGLYLKNKSTDASKIISKNEEMAISIKIISSKVTKEKLLESMSEGFENASEGKATKEEMKVFRGFFTENLKIGDKINLEYVPNKGLSVRKNSKIIGTIESLEFKKALFSIWLGSNCVDSDLKKELLGK
jgi:hypothetical protein